MDPFSLSVIGSLGLGTLNSALNYKSQKDTNKLNYQMFREGNEFAAQQAELAFNRQSDFAWQMFNAENDYNSPASQFERLMAAGLSPWDYFGKGNSLTSAQGANIGAPMASPLSPIAMRAPSFDMNMTAAADAFSKILGSVSNANLQSKQGKQILELLKPQIEKIESETTRNQIEGQVQKIQTFMNAKKLPSELRKLTSDYLRNIAAANFDDAQTDLTNLKSEFQKLQNYRYDLETIPYIENVIQTGNLLRAQANQANSAAALNESSIEVNKQLIDKYFEETRSLNLKNQYDRISLPHRLNIVADAANEAMWKSEQSYQEFLRLKGEAQKAAAEGKWAECNQAIKNIGSLLQSALIFEVGSQYFSPRQRIKGFKP